jgi:hypothetical protein
MTPDQLKDELTSALMPILQKAEQAGFLVGGTINLLQKTQCDCGGYCDCKASPPFKRIARITIARERTECVVEETRINSAIHSGAVISQVPPAGHTMLDGTPEPESWHKKVRDPEPMPKMTIDQAKAIAVLDPSSTMVTDPTLKVTGEICPNCGSGNVMRRGSCPTCNDCGTSVGGCS